MFSDFPQLVPSKICLSCQGCCRFRDEQSVWRPRVAPVELEVDAQKKELVSAVAKDGYVETVTDQGQNRCTFLDLKNNQCRIYTHRPFECRLYPFLLTRSEKDGRVNVSVHLSCPYVLQSRYSAEFEQYVGVLKAYFSAGEMARFLRDNPALAGDYSAWREEIEELFPLES